MSLPSEKLVVAGRTFRADHRHYPAKQKFDGEFLRSESLTVEFYTASGSKPLGRVRFLALAPGFNVQRFYPADEEAMDRNLVGQPNAWWADDFQKDASHPVAKRVNLSELLAMWLQSDAPRRWFQDQAKVYLCPAPIGAHDDAARVRLMSHYREHLGAQLVPGATYLAELPVPTTNLPGQATPGQRTGVWRDAA